MKPAEAFPPGKYIEEELQERGWTEEDLARFTQLSAQLLRGIIHESLSITPETAFRLGGVFETSTDYWLRLDAAYVAYRHSTEH